MCAPSFLVCAHLTTCVRTHVHSLEGTLITIPSLHKGNIITMCSLVTADLRITV